MLAKSASTTLFWSRGSCRKGDACFSLWLLLCYVQVCYIAWKTRKSQKNFIFDQKIKEKLGNLRKFKVWNNFHENFKNKISKYPAICIVEVGMGRIFQAQARPIPYSSNFSPAQSKKKNFWPSQFFFFFSIMALTALFKRFLKLIHSVACT